MSVSKITPQLFLGQYANAQSSKLLRANKIKGIVIMGGHHMKACHPKLCKYIRKTCKDTTQTLVIHFFPQIFKFIDGFINQGQNVLVHCFCGVSRSTTIVVGYLMWSQNMPFNEAFEKVAKIRSQANPNKGFRLQLMMLQEILNMYRQGETQKGSEKQIGKSDVEGQVKGGISTKNVGGDRYEILMGLMRDQYRPNLKTLKKVKQYQSQALTDLDLTFLFEKLLPEFRNWQNGIEQTQ